MRHPILRPLLPVLLLSSPFAIASELTFYGNLNIALEYRMMENQNEFPDHYELQDTYSSLGVMGSHEIAPGINGFFQYSIYIDAANAELSKSRQVKWAGDVRSEHNIALVGIEGEYGRLQVGRMWNAYYDRIAYTTDRFYAGWTGFDTYSAFQTDKTLSYSTPSWHGLDATINLVQSGVDDPSAETRIIAAGSYALPSGVVSLGYDSASDGGGEIMAIAGEYQLGAWRLAAKHEIAEPKNAYATKRAGGNKEASLSSMQVQFAWQKNTLTLHYGVGDYPSYLPVNRDDDDAYQFGRGSEFGIGLARDISDHMAVFLEYHHSDDYCAYDVTNGAGNNNYTDSRKVDANGDFIHNNGEPINGCAVISSGVNYRF
ncbi:MAG: porin [Bacterioplanes sp.]|nr:porin [Bacterioplanes sp.]